MNIGIVLSGGMAKGAYQIGALKAISEFLPTEEVKHMSCASIGVLNGYAYATGKLEQAEAMWKGICNNDARLIINQILKSSILQRDIKDLYDENQKISMDFYAALLDAKRKTMIYKNFALIDGAKTPDYLKASVAMPIYNHAVKIDGASYYDGAMVDNIPVFPLLKHKSDYIICIYFDDVSYKFENKYFDDKVISITFPAKNRLKQSLVVTEDGVDRMIEEGYEKTTDVLKYVFAKGYDNLDYIYDAIKYLNKCNKNRSLRITGDVLVTNLNKVAKRFAKRKIEV